MKRISKGWKRGGSSQGTGSTISSSGADSRGSVRSGAMGSIAFTGSSGSRNRNKNLLMETNMAFEHGSDGGRTKRSHGTGFFAFSQVPTSHLVFHLFFHFLPFIFAFSQVPTFRLVSHLFFHSLPFTFAFLTGTHFPSCLPSLHSLFAFHFLPSHGYPFPACLASLVSFFCHLTGTHSPSCLPVASGRGGLLSCHVNFPLSQ